MRFTGVAILLVTTACVPAILTGRTRPQGPGDGGRELPPGVSAGTQAQWASKKVNGKEDPNVLIAADQMRCTVTVEKYREVALGESVFCAWAK